MSLLTTMITKLRPSVTTAQTETPESNMYTIDVEAGEFYEHIDIRVGTDRSGRVYTLTDTKIGFTQHDGTWYEHGYQIREQQVSMRHVGQQTNYGRIQGFFYRERTNVLCEYYDITANNVSWNEVM